MLTGDTELATGGTNMAMTSSNVAQSFAYTFAATLEQDATSFAAIRRRRRKTAGHGSQPPFLNICLDEDETKLTKVDVDAARTIGTDSWEEVV